MVNMTEIENQQLKQKLVECHEIINDYTEKNHSLTMHLNTAIESIKVYKKVESKLKSTEK